MHWLRRFRPARPGPPKGVVLLYHRIVGGQVDPYALDVSPEHFDQHMAVLKEKFMPLPVGAFLKHLKTQSLPTRAVAVTFDDGYIDNFEVAGPILERHGIDATIYMVTGPGGREREFWWDELERIMLSPGTLPRQLTLQLQGRRYQGDLGDAADYPADIAASHLDWKLPWSNVPDDEADVPTPRHRVFREVYLLLQPMPTEQQDDVLEALRDWSGASRAVRPSHRTIALERLADTIADTPIQIGAHTVDHPALNIMRYSQQADQLATSRDRLESLMAKPVTTASYPFGLYSRKTLRAANRCGFEAAFICGQRAVSYGVNPVEIPRVQLPDIDGDAFESLLCESLGIAQTREVFA